MPEGAQEGKQEKPKKPAYVGIFLSEEARKNLLSIFPPAHAVVFADHITLTFKPTEEELLQAPIGVLHRLDIVGLVKDEKCQAVLVRGIRCQSGVPHITISTVENIPPVYSQELIRQWQEAEHLYAEGPVLLTLEGICDTFPRTIKEVAIGLDSQNTIEEAING